MRNIKLKKINVFKNFLSLIMPICDTFFVKKDTLLSLCGLRSILCNICSNHEQRSTIAVKKIIKSKNTQNPSYFISYCIGHFFYFIPSFYIFCNNIYLDFFRFFFDLKKNANAERCSCFTDPTETLEAGHPI
jgi:hypothetical protein